MLTLEEMLQLEAKCYVAMAEVDYDLKKWYQRHYSPSLGIQRAFLTAAYDMKRAFERGAQSWSDTSLAIQKATTKTSKQSS